MLKMNQTQKIDFLLALYITCLVSSELLGSKVAALGPVNASVGIFVIPITFLIDDVIVEVCGKQRAQNFVKIGFMMLAFLFAFTLLATYLPPATRYMKTNAAYGMVFAQSARIIAASLTSYFVSESFDVLLYQLIRKKTGQKHLWFRTNFSNFVSEFLDTVLFMMLAFYRPGNFWFVMGLVIPYWLLKCGFSLVETPLTYLGVNWLRGDKKDGVPATSGAAE